MKSENRAWLILIILALVWGSSFILIKKSMFPVDGERVLNPYQMGALRIVIAGLVLLPFGISNLKHLTKKDFLPLLVVGVCGNFLPATLFSIAGSHIDSSLAGMLNMGTSFFVVILGILFYKSNPSKYQIAGILLGGTGLYLILRSQLSFDMSQVQYALLILVATLFYATSLTTIKFKLQHLPAMTITSLAFFMIVWPAIITAFFFDAFTPLVTNPDGMKSLGFLTILSVVGTATAVFLFNKLITISSPIFASGVTYLMPVVAILMGVLDGDDFKFINIIWIIIIITGVWLLNNGPKKFAK
jgi:drug/metabolite transporter (DMT)-like permease